MWVIEKMGNLFARRMICQLSASSSFNRSTDHQFVNEASMIAGAFCLYIGKIEKLLLGTKYHKFFHFTLATQ